MKKLDYSHLSVCVKSSLLLGLLLVPFGARADLPQEGFPLGRADLPEVRTIKELRPGLTHVHIERGAWPKGEPPKIALMNVEGPVTDRTLLAPFKECMESVGYVVREHQFRLTMDSELHYVMLAGEFDSNEKARQATRTAPCPARIANLVDFPDWTDGPWAFDIVIVDPKVYRGKIVSAWSGRAWRASPLELARERNAVVATNGSFFEYSIDEIGGVPTGISIVEGVWHHEPQPPDHRAPMLFLDNDPVKGTSLSIGSNADAPPFPEFKWVGPDRANSVELNGLDRMPKDDELVAITPGIWRTSPLSHYTPPNVMVRQIGEDGYLAYGVNWWSTGSILLATGSKQTILEEATASRKQVELDLRVRGRSGLNAWYVVPILMKDGNPVFSRRSNVGRSPRTALGADAEGKIYLIVIDRADALDGGSIGVTLPELRQVVQALELTNAANLDGGSGSTSMVIEGKIMGRDSSHWMTAFDDERRVGDVVLIIDEGI